MSELNRGAELTRAYLTETKQPQAELARRCKVSGVTAHNWLRGSMRPERERRRLISRWTKGRVPVKSWDEPVAAVAEAA